MIKNGKNHKNNSRRVKYKNFTSGKHYKIKTLREGETATMSVVYDMPATLSKVGFRLDGATFKFWEDTNNLDYIKKKGRTSKGSASDAITEIDDLLPFTRDPDMTKEKLESL